MYHLGVDPSAAAADKWTKFASSTVPQPVAQAVDMARSLQDRFIDAQRDFMRMRLDSPPSRAASDTPAPAQVSAVAADASAEPKPGSSSHATGTSGLGFTGNSGVQSKVLAVYCKGYLEVQRAYCSAKVSAVMSSSSGGTIDSPVSTPTSMVLPDLQHLLFLGLMPPPPPTPTTPLPATSLLTSKPQHPPELRPSSNANLAAAAMDSLRASKLSATNPSTSIPPSAASPVNLPASASSRRVSGPTISSSSPSSPSSTQAQARKEAIAQHTQLFNQIFALVASQRTYPSSGGPSDSPPLPPPRPVAPLFEPLCVKASDVASTLREAGSLTDLGAGTCMQLQTGMYRLLRHSQVL